VPRVAAGTDDVVEGERQRLAQRGEGRGVAVDRFLYPDAFGLRGQDVLEGVVVGAGERADLLAELPRVAGEYGRCA
jgi:hypothetical protein